METRRSLNQLRFAVAMFVALTLARSASLKNFTRRRRLTRERWCIRTYEIGDLVLAVPDYELEGGRRAAAGGGSGGFAPGMGGWGRRRASSRGRVDSQEAGVSAVQGPRPGWTTRAGSPRSGPSPLTMDSVIQVMFATVVPNSWAGSGGDGQATALGTSLGRATNECGPAGHRSDCWMRSGRISGSPHDDDRRSLVVARLGRAREAGDGGRQRRPDDQPRDSRRIHRASRRACRFISCFSGQSVFLTSGTVRTNVSSYIPVVGSIEPPKPEVMFAAHGGDRRVSFVADERQSVFGGRSVGYQPVTTTTNFGVQVELRPTRLHPEKAAAVDLRSTITFPAGTSSEGRVGTSDERSGAAGRSVGDSDAGIGHDAARAVGRTGVGGRDDRYGAEAGGGGRWDGRSGRDAAGEAAEKPQLYLILEVK